jgi:hypothetical protein
MRHQHAGLAVTGFPLAFDQYLWPPTHAEFINQLNVDRMDHRDFDPITALHIQVHMLHRTMALILFIAGGVFTGWSFKRLGRRHLLGRFTIFWFSLLCLQVFLGVATIWSNKAADIATAHVLIGALTLALGSFMVLAARRSVYLAKHARTKSSQGVPSDLIPTSKVAVGKVMKTTVETMEPQSLTARSVWSVFSDLVKVRLTTLVLLTTLAGFYLASVEGMPVFLLLHHGRNGFLGLWLFGFESIFGDAIMMLVCLALSVGLSLPD